LLQGDAEHSHPPNFVSHHVQKVTNVGSFLNIVGQVEMGIVELIIAGLGARRPVADKQKQSDRPDKETPLSERRERLSHFHLPITSFYFAGEFIR
jgi:hypothetical protein